MKIKISVIIPTINKPSLKKIVKKILGQLRSCDELIVVGDGVKPALRDRAKQFLIPSMKTNDWGGSQRNIGISLARGSHIAFLDDDDDIEKDYIEKISEAAWLFPHCVNVFKIKHQAVGGMWRFKSVSLGNVSSQNFVIPNARKKLPKWGKAYDSDYFFAKECTRLFGVQWHESLIATWNGLKK